MICISTSLFNCITNVSHDIVSTLNRCHFARLSRYLSIVELMFSNFPEQLRRHAVFCGNESNHMLEEVVKEEFQSNGVEVIKFETLS